jgi:hypothetical protein
MNWEGKDGDLYTDRNSPDIDKRAIWFDKILPDDIDSVLETGCNKGHNLIAIKKVRPVKVYGIEVNEKAKSIAKEAGIQVTFPPQQIDLKLFSGILIHQNPIDLFPYFQSANCAEKYIMFIEHKEESIRTINSRWYTNAMWVMDFGKEFITRFPDWKIIKKGYVNGKAPKEIDYTAPLKDTATGFHPADYYWLMERR